MYVTPRDADLVHTSTTYNRLKTAFDTVDHALLCTKMEFDGVRDVACKWLNSYLDLRKQYVSIDGCKSNVRSISCGVPQGSIPGPKLFIMYVNDMCNISKLVKFILFADDTNILCTDPCIMRLKERVCDVLAILDTWFTVNKLSLKMQQKLIICYLAGERSMLTLT